VKLVFGCTELDKNGWVQDFGRLKNIKAWLENTFDHKTLVAKDDPALSEFRRMAQEIPVGGATVPPLIQLVEVEAVGCEAFAKLIWNQVSSMILSDGRVYLKEVHVNEHEANGVTYRRID
jgi:6-pyruvoyltetrahydropterin/6-carboxytetrahydropterin synthase